MVFWGLSEYKMLLSELRLTFFCRQLDETQLMVFMCGNDNMMNVPVFSFSDDLASKANIIIDPAEIQATSMDDLDEDDESGAAQVMSCLT